MLFANEVQAVCLIREVMVDTLPSDLVEIMCLDVSP